MKNWHNIKMIVLSVITIAIAGMGAVYGGMTSTPAWVATVSMVLLLIEHLLNGNTSTTA